MKIKYGQRRELKKKGKTIWHNFVTMNVIDVCVYKYIYIYIYVKSIATFLNIRHSKEELVS